MKKTFSLLLALVMVLSLTACGGKDTPADDANTPNTPTENNQPYTQQPSESANKTATILSQLPLTTMRAMKLRPPMKRPLRRSCAFTKAPLRP